MKLGNWDILSPNSEVVIWSNNENKILIELKDKILAKLALLPDDVVIVSSCNCSIRIDEKYKTINIMS